MELKATLKTTGKSRNPIKTVGIHMSSKPLSPVTPTLLQFLHCTVEIHSGTLIILISDAVETVTLLATSKPEQEYIVDQITTNMDHQSRQLLFVPHGKHLFCHLKC